MMSSNDFAETFNRVANGTSPYYAQVNTTSPYKFVRNASKIPANRYFSLVSLSNGARGYRKQLNLNQLFTTQSHLPDYISANSKATIYTVDGKKLDGVTTAVYATAAQNFLTNEINNVNKNWENYKNSAGIN
jgi:hypothetical protein